jgi:L-iditol 2-dehydrogenase
MLAAVYYSNSDVRVQEYPKPAIQDDEVLLKVMACGVCGSDVTEWYRLPTAPRVLGHEATGIIVEKGRNVTQYNVGDRVFVSHHVPCNECRYCLRGHQTACETLHRTNFYPGGFAQFVRVPKINVEKGIYKLPADMTFEEGTFIEPVACAIRGQKLAGVQPGDDVFIIGAGVSGILHMQLAKAAGAERVIVSDVNAYRLKMAEKLGADYVIDAADDTPRKLREINDGRPADHVIICTGATQAALVALESVDKGGTILFFAVPDPSTRIPLPVTRFWRNEVALKTSYGAAPNDLKEALELLSHRTINVADMITHRFSIQEAVEAFRTAAKAGKSLKVIIEPNKL